MSGPAQAWLPRLYPLPAIAAEAQGINVLWFWSCRPVSQIGFPISTDVNPNGNLRHCNRTPVKTRTLVVDDEPLGRENLIAVFQFAWIPRSPKFRATDHWRSRETNGARGVDSYSVFQAKIGARSLRLTIRSALASF